MKLSIIIPVYNTAPYLERCINSILNQSYQDFEIILINDGSTDKSADICNIFKRANEKIHVIHQKNQGLSVSRNNGLKAAVGDYVMFVDSDDWITDGCLKVIADCINKSSYDLIIGRFICSPEEGAVKIEDIWLDSSYINGQSGDEVAKYICNLRNYLYVATRYICNRVFLLNEKLFFYPGMLHEDEEWTPRVLCKARSFFLIETPFYVYATRAEGSITSSRRIGNICNYWRGAYLLNEFNIRERNVLSEAKRCLIEKRIEFLLRTIGYFSMFTMDELMQIDDFFKQNSKVKDYILHQPYTICRLMRLIGVRRGRQLYRILRVIYKRKVRNKK